MAAATLAGCFAAGCVNPGADPGQSLPAARTATLRADDGATRAAASAARARTLAGQIEADARELLSAK